MSQPRSIVPRDSWNAGVLALFLLAWVFSCIALPYPEYFAMQHVPTALFILGLLYVERTVGISRLSFALMIGFMLLHVLGARYLYSYVPYDDWSQWMLGIRIGDQFGFERNHYDRLVHFAFGLMFVLPFWELLEKRFQFPAVWAAVGSMCAILAAGAVYEVAEWAVAMIFAPDWAESYNGQQGDIWDAQKDMALAWAGSIVGVTCVALRRKLKNRRQVWAN
jgi:putative membrane protein